MDEKHKIHAKYILSILITIIILLVTVQWGQITKLVEYITFALTVTSIVLAVLAISYAVYSNTSFIQIVATLNSASQKVSEVSSIITEATNELEKKVASIPEKIEALGEQLTLTHSAVIEIAERAKTQQPAVSVKTSDSPQKVRTAEQFLEYCSAQGLVGIYALSRAYSQNKPLSLMELDKKLSGITPNYIYGHSAAMVAAGFFGISYGKDMPGTWKITAANEELVSHISKINDYIIKKVEDEGARKGFLENIKIIDAYIS